MKQSEKMKDLLAQQRKLNDNRPSKPSQVVQYVLHEKSVDNLSKNELIKIIAEEDYWFAGDDDYITICWNKYETPEQTTARHQAEIVKMKEWTDSIARVQQLIDAEQIAMKNAKKILDARYSDPEYIEYLRMQAKMKECGFIE